MSRHWEQPRRLRRAESFFGLHFDFHATHTDVGIGAHLDTIRATLDHWLDRVHPDYVQCDGKGHHGLSSYPTKVETPVPGIVGDILHVWRERTAAHGVALYIHYSGVWDVEAVRQHPDWASRDAQGYPDTQTTSIFGSYVDTVLIPQLRELYDKYGVDGAWIDGDCWSVRPDYADAALLALQAQIPAVTDLPITPDDRSYPQFLAVCREGFRAYARHYVNTLHQHAANFQIASNWAFSSYMPEPVTLPVDFLSGDLTMQDSVNAARFEGRVLAEQAWHAQLPWDLMAWSFTGTLERGDFSPKTALQLCQEAASVLALGGGFQSYIVQQRDGAPPLDQLDTLATVAAFCRARQSYCQGTRAVPSVALLLPRAPLERARGGVFPNDQTTLAPTRGILQCLLNASYAVAIVIDHTLTARLTAFETIVVPEWMDLATEQIHELRAYVAGGGALVLVGADAARAFQDELGVNIEEDMDATAMSMSWVEYQQQRVAIPARLPHVQTRADRTDVQPFGVILPTAHFNSSANHAQPDWADQTMAASCTSYGAGRIGALYFPLGRRYREAEVSTLRVILTAIMNAVMPEPLITITGTHLVDVAVQQPGEGSDTLYIHLVNTAGPHANPLVQTFDEIPPLGPFTVTLRSMQAPTSVFAQPEGRQLPFSYANGRITITIPRLALYDVLVIE